MTHAELVQIGARYMRKTLRCSPVLTERKCMFASEVPDVIGWRCGGCKPHPLHDTLDSFVIEVKVNRADFLRDMKKTHRNGPAYVADAENLTFSQAINTLIQRGFAGKRTKARAAASRTGAVFSFWDAAGEKKAP